MTNDKVWFTVDCEMRARWVPHFLGMLKLMQCLGSRGSSRVVSFYADGDGDFNPRFTFDNSLPIAKPQRETFFDAG